MNGTATSSPNLSEQNLLIAFCLENDAPFLPTSGEWATKALAKFLQMEDETLKGWIKDYQIPHRGTSRTTFVDVVELRNRLPENFMFEPKEPKETGKDAKKTKSTRKR